MCDRCGQCCTKNMWEQSNLSKEQMARLEGLLNPPCRALDIVNGVPTCRVQLHFGYEAKPEKCKQYDCKDKS